MSDDAPPPPGPLDDLPRLARGQVALERLTRREAPRFEAMLGWLGDALGDAPEFDPPEVHWRGASLGRPGVIAQLTWPRLRARLAVGIETTLTHAIVDRLLGYARLPGEERAHVTPVEWGILTYVVARLLDSLAAAPGRLGPWDLQLDRVSPDPFRADDLGPLVTLRWPVRLGELLSSIRLWLPESLVMRWLAASPEPTADLDHVSLRGRYAELAGTWRAEAGTLAMPRGLGRLRVGGVLPLDPERLRGTTSSPVGRVELTSIDPLGRSAFDAEPAPSTSAGRLTITSAYRRQPTPREALSVPPSSDTTAPPTPSISPADVPVTLTVELGRVNLPLARLADLKPGDVVELGRHSREPVELTSNGRLVARGELVQIDTELGVRVLSVFL